MSPGVRDAALTMDVVVELYAAATDPNAVSGFSQILSQYAEARIGQQNDPNLQTGLGEPKFELNNSVFTGPWGRPQNDGPAEAATTLLRFATAYLDKGGDLDNVKEKIWNAPVLPDLQFVASNWSNPSFDLWEEESADHFFNRMVSHKALIDGAVFASSINDSDTANTLSTAARAIADNLPSFWDQEKQLLVYEVGPVLLNKSSYKDIAVILGILHGYVEDELFRYSNDQVLATAYQVATSFLAIFPIANVTTDSSGGALGIPIGYDISSYHVQQLIYYSRYPEDVYTGTGTAENGGNPWFLATATMAELFYRAATDFKSSNNLTTTDTSLPFWTYFAPAAGLSAGATYAGDDDRFFSAVSALEGWADAFMRRIKYHTPADKTLTEQYNRNNGVSTGASNLTWSYASVLTAAFARAALQNDTEYIRMVANI